MIKAPIDLQDLRRRLSDKAKAEPAWRFWGLYVHVCKTDTLREAYALAKKNNGAPGIDGVTFEAIEASGVEGFLQQIRDELAAHRYRPMRNRRQEIPKDGGKDTPSNWRSPPRPDRKRRKLGRPYNRQHREVGRRREGDGWARSSGEAG